MLWPRSTSRPSRCRIGPGGPGAPESVATTWACRVRRPSVPSAISRRTQSRARSGTGRPRTRNTGVAIAGVVSVIETIGAGARLDPVEPAAGLAPARLCGAGHDAGWPGTTGVGGDDLGVHLVHADRARPGGHHVHRHSPPGLHRIVLGRASRA